MYHKIYEKICINYFIFNYLLYLLIMEKKMLVLPIKIKIIEIFFKKILLKKVINLIKKLRTKILIKVGKIKNIIFNQ